MTAATRFRLPRLFWIGIGILVVGSGPLLLFLAADGLGFVADPNPNPIGLGLLFFVSFWPGVVLTGAGLLVAALTWLRG